MYFPLTEVVIESLTIVLPWRSVPIWAAILNQGSSWFPSKVMSHLLTVKGGNAKLSESSGEEIPSMYSSSFECEDGTTN